MQITDKIRGEIAMYLPKLGMEEVNQIATRNSCTIHAVYRILRRLKGTEEGNTDIEHPVVMDLLELAIRKKKEKRDVLKRIGRIEKQFSEKSAA